MGNRASSKPRIQRAEARTEFIVFVRMSLPPFISESCRRHWYGHPQSGHLAGHVVPEDSRPSGQPDGASGADPGSAPPGLATKAAQAKSMCDWARTLRVPNLRIYPPGYACKAVFLIFSYDG